MSEIKPVAWMYEKDIDGIDVTVKVFRQYRQDLYPWKETSLYAVPDTHRMVPVELLKRMLPGGGLWNLEELRAIIDKVQS